MAMEMGDAQAYKTFRKMTEPLCSLQDKGETGAAMAETEPRFIPAVFSVPEVEEDEIADEEQKESHPSTISIGYGGFLYIKCPDCGKIKGFCAKTRLSNFRCECGSVTRLENLVPLYMNCECGRNSRYLTNMEEPAFDMICYDCGNPVAVEWNSKKRQYETIRG